MKHVTKMVLAAGGEWTRAGRETTRAAQGWNVGMERRRRKEVCELV